MAKPHWQVLTQDTQGNPTPDGFGCQHTTCTNKATWQWQRHATDTETTTEHNLQGPHGTIHRNPQGPHHTAVFACNTHAFPDKNGNPNLNILALIHDPDCPAPDPGCNC